MKQISIFALLSLIVLLSLSLCHIDLNQHQLKDYIQNKDFTPENYKEPGWYQSRYIHPWLVDQKQIISFFLTQSQVYISNWKKEGITIPGQDTTMLRMRFNRVATYKQRIFASKGTYDLSALILNLDRHASLQFDVNIEKKYFTTKIKSRSIKPSELVLAQFYVPQDTKIITIKLYEKDQYPQYARNGIYISNVRIKKITQSLSRIPVNSY